MTATIWRGVVFPSIGERRLTLDNGRFSPPPMPTKGALMRALTENEAIAFSHDVIGLLLKHQEHPLGGMPLGSEEDAQDAAKNIAAFRRALIEELQKPQ
ncbi:hypothetical protein OIN59_11990 [Acidovorax sp. D2M1]|uniref:Uncharacterized protein n=1 Tax=Acidovorax benzenivorans TaxID=2987520 RepID=A0ABT5RWT8_9BURK|nr:hypothetical protein [Acidovorax benzenivorans]MDD2178156.1 hypothetical protein [Acidovorax benzenivorans]